MRPLLASWPHALLAFSLSLSLATPALPIVKFNDGHDEVFVTASAGIGYDSNIYAIAGGASDTTLNASLDLDYQRKAGMLGVNANIGWNFTRFDDNTSEDFADPHMRAEITKGTGRTTGSLSVGAARESRAETTLNLRTTSWNYDATLNAKYPVIERYSIAGSLGYGYQDYSQNNGLFDIRTYSASSDVYYVYTSERDIIGGYRVRVTDTSAQTRSTDHAFTLGTTGKLLPKLNGTFRFGYQFRETDRGAGGGEDRYNAFTSAIAATWSVSRRLNITAQASRDFSTLATDVNVDTTGGGIDAQFAVNARWTFFAGAGAGHTRFLAAGSAGRRDTYATGSVGVNYTLNEHLKVTLSGMHYTNWSVLDQGDYERRTVSLAVSSRW